MDLPRTIKIGAYDYRVREVEPYELTDASNVGQASHRTMEILINRHGDRNCAHATLLHELMHCIIYHWHVSAGDDQERFVSTLEEGLACVMKDNPDLFSAISAAFHKGE